MLWIRQVLEVTRQTSVRLLANRMLHLIGGLGVLASLLILLLPDRAFQQGEGRLVYGLLTYWTVIQIAIPFAVLFFGVSVFHGGLEDRSMTFLFVRPLRRSAILLGNWLGTVLVCWCVAALILLIGYVCFAWPDRPWRHGIVPPTEMVGWFVWGAGLACASYAALAVLASALWKRPLVWGILFVVGWEGVVSNLPPAAGVNSLTAAEPIRRWVALKLSPSSGERLQDVLLRRSGEPVDFEGLGDPLVAVLRFTVIVLVLALFVFGRREYDARPRD